MLAGKLWTMKEGLTFLKTVQYSEIGRTRTKYFKSNQSGMGQQGRRTTGSKHYTGSQGNSVESPENKTKSALN